MTLGAALEAMIARANSEVLLVAPFVKHGVVSRLLTCVARNIPVRIVTRWHPAEVAAGVNDVEVFDLIEPRANGAVWLCQCLHAKYYRADDTVLMGSANLTGQALGWSKASNLELLIDVPANTPSLKTFERQLWTDSVRATREMRDAVQKAAALFPETQKSTMPVVWNAVAGRAPLWIPNTRRPEVLFRAYSAGGHELTTAAAEQSAADLEHLGLPSGLSEDAFAAAVGAILLQERVVNVVERACHSPQRFGAVRDVLSDALKDHATVRDPSEAWQTLLRWLLHFLPKRYSVRVTNYSEVFSLTSAARSG